MTTILFKSETTKPSATANARPLGPLPSSVRVPVTPANREYLRAIRQAELAAWRNAPGGTWHGRRV